MKFKYHTTIYLVAMLLLFVLNVITYTFSYNVGKSIFLINLFSFFIFSCSFDVSCVKELLMSKGFIMALTKSIFFENHSFIGCIIIFDGS